MHELTARIWKCYGEESKIEKEVVGYLREAAEKIHRIKNIGYRGTEVREILGLQTEPEEPCHQCSFPDAKGIHVCRDPKPEKPEVGEMDWCKHITTRNGLWWLMGDTKISYGVDYDWNQCPICGTPRPVEKSLREQLAEKLYYRWKFYIEDANTIEFKNTTKETKQSYLDQADEAISFLRGKSL